MSWIRIPKAQRRL
ncbi:hypothetical protein Bhyg_17515, partial [Pseudolycoriella hygida]